MSYDRTYRTTRTTTRNAPRRRVHFAPPPPGGHSRQHSVLGYWVPLVTIGTIAVGGLAAWIWSERSDHDDDHYPDDKPPRPPTGLGGPYPTQGSQPYPGPPPGGPGVIPLQDQTTQGIPPPVGAEGQMGFQGTGEAASYYGTSSSSQAQARSTDVRRSDETFLERASGIMRRTPSPQQFFDSASKQVTAGLAAAGSALGSIMEVESNADQTSERHDRSGSRHEEREGFSDHERWSEEAEERQQFSTAGTGGRVKSVDEQRGKGRAKRMVAVVVSADFDAHASEDDAFQNEHGSILSHLPDQFDPSRTDLFVLIYAPGLKSLPSISYQPGAAPSTLGSSYSEINTPAATPGSELQSISPKIDATDLNSRKFEALYNQALALVSHPTQIMPFTTSDGYVSMLRHLAPQLVYISDTLSGQDGGTVAQLKGWVGHTVLVVGDDGHGGLADTETETEDERGAKKEREMWWEHSSFVGLGKEVDVVDAARVGDDWERRVNARD